MLKMIDHVRIGHIDYAVRERNLQWSITSGNDADCQFSSGVINVCTEGHCDASVLESLWHEVSHAINRLASITDRTDEEEQVLRTSPIWIQVFRDNPGFRSLINKFCDRNGVNDAVDNQRSECS